MEFLVELDMLLREEKKIQEVGSAGSIFLGGVPEDLEGVKDVLSEVPGSDEFFNSRYGLTPVFISADISADSEKIKEVNNRVIEIVESASIPGGVRVSVTGNTLLLSSC